MSYVEIICELTTVGHRLADIARMTDKQIAFVLFRERDDHGRLVRPKDAAPKVSEAAYDRDVESIGWYDGDRVQKVMSFEASFKDAKRAQSDLLRGRILDGRMFAGLTSDQIEQMWQDYLRDEPVLAAQINQVKYVGGWQ